jgi:CARDB
MSTSTNSNNHTTASKLAVHRKDKYQNQTERKIMKTIKFVVSILGNSLLVSTAILMATTASTLAKPSLSTNSEYSQLNKVAIVQKTSCSFDLAAQKLEFTYFGPQNVNRRQVRVTGVIRNVGTTNFQPPASAKIYITTSLLSTTPLPNLAPGQEVKVMYDTTWDSSSPSEGEFPPNYTLQIDYPISRDIGSSHGGIPSADCNNKNNRVERNISDVKNAQIVNPPPLGGGGNLPTQIK